MSVLIDSPEPDEARLLGFRSLRESAMPAMPRHSVIRPHGTIIITDPDLPHEVQRDTLQCCHCQAIWIVSPGSGRRRGFCTKCNQVTCGAGTCGHCLPFEKKLELYEAGKITSL